MIPAWVSHQTNLEPSDHTRSDRRYPTGSAPCEPRDSGPPEFTNGTASEVVRRSGVEIRRSKAIRPWPSPPSNQFGRLRWSDACQMELLSID